MNHDTMVRRAAVALFALAAVVACSESDLAAPSSAVVRRASAERIAPNDDAKEQHGDSRSRLASCGGRHQAAGSGVFGPSGGTLIVGDARLEIPGGALRESIRISGVTRDDSTAAIDFEPEGLRFRKAVTLVLSADGCALPIAAAPKVVYLAPDGTVLETIDAMFENGRHAVSAPIEHFSGYAIAF